jgi:hypothetical protein
MLIALIIFIVAFVVTGVASINSWLEAGANERALEACRETLYGKTTDLRDRTKQYDELSMVLKSERQDAAEINNRLKFLEGELSVANAIKDQQSIDLKTCRSNIERQSREILKEQDLNRLATNRVRVLEVELEDLELLRKTFTPAPAKHKTRAKRVAPTRK